MKKSAFILFFLFFAMTAMPVYAQFYQWVDQDGVKHFTDNVLEIPRDQRPGAKVHEDTQRQVDSETLIEEIPAEEETSKTTAELQRQHKLLSEKKQALDLEYNNLKAKQQTLKDQEGKMEINQYNEQIQLLNTQITTFENKRLEYEKQVLEYNRQVDEKK